MKLTAQEQIDIRSHLASVSVSNTVDELYDHVVTAMEAKKDTTFNMGKVKQFIDTEFSEMVNTPREQRRYRIINNITGFVLFAAATLIYWLTMEPTVSFWDCGEFIAAANKMEVGHQPGAPLFLVIGRLFSLLALGDKSLVAYWVNFGSALASAASIMFLFWTITALGVKIYAKDKLASKIPSIIAAGIIGATAFLFSDTFWFSAVEAEVYALSALFTAVTFWAILKWDKNLNDRWLIFIAFLVGLSTGVHLLNLLAIPAVTLIYYYRKTPHITWFGTLKAFLAGCALVGLVQFGILQYLVLFAAKADLFFVNTLGSSFGLGALAFIIAVFGAVAYGLYYSVRKKMYRFNLGLLCLLFILFGFSSYFIIIIRANAKPNINLSNPDNAFALYNYLGRTNYEGAPLLYGKTFDAEAINHEVTGNTYRKGKDRYEITGNTYKTTYDNNLLFPRTHSEKPAHQDFYRNWLGLDKEASPTLADNIKFFSSWQVGVMYWRYFMWNFAGKQNDEQGYGDVENGNWLSGISVLDGQRLGNQGNLPQSITLNAGFNKFYCIPFVAGIVGLIWLFRRNRYIGIALTVLFFCTGLAIILVLNQDPLQVRERDYAYVGSFYTFAIFIGFGVLAFKDVLHRFIAERYSIAIAGVCCFAAIPILMGVEGWDDHNRAGRTTALDFARNYLNSCEPNAILFTNADNDTYPLWYVQEVEGFRTDVRVICIQFLADDSFIDQMKNQSYASAPLPISMSSETYREGVRDYLPYVDYGITDSVELSDLMAVMTSDSKADQVEMRDGTYSNFLPSRKLKMTVNADQIIKTGTLPATRRAQIAPALEWTFKKSFAGKADLTMFDILVTNNWKRPVYFATSVSEDTYLGLDKYLYLEGYAYRLLPLVPATDFKTKEAQANADVMHQHVTAKMDLSGFKKAKYLDPESRRVINSTWKFNNALITQLIAEGKRKKAIEVMEKSMKDLPMRNYSVGDTLGKLFTVQNLYALNKTGEANKLASDTAGFLKSEMNYIATLEPYFKQQHFENAQLGLYVLEGLLQTTAHYKQGKLHANLRAEVEKMVKAFEI